MGRTEVASRLEAVSGTLVCSEERPRKVDSSTCAVLGRVHSDAAVQPPHSKKQADLAAAWHGEVLRGSVAICVVTARRSRAVLMAGVAACALALSCRKITRGQKPQRSTLLVTSARRVDHCLAPAGMKPRPSCSRRRAGRESARRARRLPLGLGAPTALRLAQLASLNSSLFGSKRDRKIAASIGSWKQ
jgi:hypothetical protein